MKRKPCPYCGAEFGQTPEFKFGCTNYRCPEMPRYHDPIGNPYEIDDFWDHVHKQAIEVKRKKHKQLAELTVQVNNYYIIEEESEIENVCNL